MGSPHPQFHGWLSFPAGMLGTYEVPKPHGKEQSHVSLCLLVLQVDEQDPILDNLIQMTDFENNKYFCAYKQCNYWWLSHPLK